VVLVRTSAYRLPLLTPLPNSAPNCLPLPSLHHIVSTRPRACTSSIAKDLFLASIDVQIHNTSKQWHPQLLRVCQRASFYTGTSTDPDTFTGEPPSHRQRTRSKSPRSRPTTPLRPSSRSSLRDSVQRGRGAASSGNALEGLQDGFAELSDAMADLEQNFVQLQLMHESLARFSESFAGFLYGMNMNAFCVDFPEVWKLWTTRMHHACNQTGC
jgi:hypothetical protein